MSPYQRSQGRQERSRQTRDALVRAALDLWRERGYEATTIKEISHAAGVAWSTFYFHFPNKGDLLAHLSGMTAERLARETGALLRGPGSLEEWLLSFCEHLDETVRDLPRDLLGQMTSRILPGIATLRGRPDEGPVSLDVPLATIFEASKRAGEVPPDYDCGEAAAIFAAMVMEAMLRWSVGSTPDATLGAAFVRRVRTFLEPPGLPSRPALVGSAPAGGPAPDEGSS